MIEKTMKEFLSDAENLTVGAVINDDFLTIKTDRGNAVLINEDEWNILRDAFKITIGMNK